MPKASNFLPIPPDRLSPPLYGVRWRAKAATRRMMMSNEIKTVLNQYMDSHGGGDGLFTTALPGFYLMRASTLTMPKPAIYRPALCIIIDGAKQIMFGARLYTYTTMQALVISVEMPAFGQVIEAS